MPISAYHTPGVYVEEIPSGARSITAVNTSIAAFIGTAPRVDHLVNTPQAVNDWSDFKRRYVPESDDKSTHPDDKSTHLYNAVYGFFQNGGAYCFIVNTGTQPTITNALAALETEDAVAIVAAPGHSDPASYQAIRSHCELLKDRMGILDPPKVVSDIELLTQVGTVDAPSAKRGADTGDAEKPKPAGLAEGPKPGAVGPPRSDLLVMNYPWIRVMDPITNTLADVPPSGHVAGIWARTDMTAGVHKAPAGLRAGVNEALDVTHRLTRQEQGVLNDAGINCVRLFPRDGLLLWAARTLAADPAWRYINVRRLFLMVEESIQEGTNWIVFEGNNLTTQLNVRRELTAFLTRVWRDGALVGATPEEAFFVKCDAETNPPEVVDAGQLVAMVGMAPVKPAEFVIFQIMQETPGAVITPATSAA
jgi:phage tail sheath protein FI